VQVARQFTVQQTLVQSRHFLLMVFAHGWDLRLS
jgi:hypothetical protein